MTNSSLTTAAIPAHIELRFQYDVCRTGGFHRVGGGTAQGISDDGWAVLVDVDIMRMTSMYLVEHGITQSIDATTLLLGLL